MEKHLQRARGDAMSARRDGNRTLKKDLKFEFDFISVSSSLFKQTVSCVRVQTQFSVCLEKIFFSFLPIVYPFGEKTERNRFSSENWLLCCSQPLLCIFFSPNAGVRGDGSRQTMSTQRRRRWKWNEKLLHGELTSNMVKEQISGISEDDERERKNSKLTLSALSWLLVFAFSTLCILFSSSSTSYTHLNFLPSTRWAVCFTLLDM